ELRARAEHLAPAVLGDVRAGDDVRIVMHVGATIEGIVTRASDRAPVAGTRIVALGEASEPLFEGVTDVAGRYRSGALNPGLILLRVIPVDEVPARQEIR